MIVGKPPGDEDQVILVDDVITAGLSIEASVELLRAQGHPPLRGIVIAVDRMEKSS